ncbi:MAG: putative arabinose efflux permease, family [Rhizobacter sp.]|nr:putative arabinose efflux permease, family [Rhizobacter sp.]
MASAIPTDALLYLLLPLYASSFGLGLPQVGVLLAANRLVRIAGYGRVAKFYAERGDRPTISIALLAATCCALAWATLSGFWLLLVARLVWGLCFGAFNLSTQALSIAEIDGAAKRSGRSRALIALGPMIALPLGAWVTVEWGPRVIFFGAAALAASGLFLGRKLPLRSTRHDATSMPPVRRFGLPIGLDVWAFVEGVIIDGLFIIGLTLLVQRSGVDLPVLTAAALMSSRYLAEIFLSPIGGHVAHRVGAERTLLIFSLMTCVALVAFGCGLLIAGAFAIMSLRAVQLPLLPVIVGHRFHGAQRVQALVARSLWRDIGAGVGPLIGGVVLPMFQPWAIYSVGAFLLATATVVAVDWKRAAVEETR